MKKLSKYAKVMTVIGVVFTIAGIISIIFNAGNLSALFFTIAFVVIYANLMTPEEERYVKRKNTYVEP